jgi:Acyl-CoA reductase (LuxC)
LLDRAGRDARRASERAVSRTAADRVADVRRLLNCARTVYDQRARIAPAIAAATGLTPEGVELGFASLEREASDADLRALVAGAGEAAHVHVVLSANVFVAPLRALALARAAADRVTVRPSPRDPVLAVALLDAARAAGDSAFVPVDERDVAHVEAEEIHVYGRDATVAAVRARVRPGVVVLAHAAGMGMALVSSGADLHAAARALALDVVAFDQRGCLSPRVAMVLGDEARAERFAEALHAALIAQAAQVPRGRLLDDERIDARRWRDALTFAGRVWAADDSAVALAPAGTPLYVPPAGRHVTVMPAASRDAVVAAIAPLAAHVVAVGTDAPRELGALAPSHARLSALGAMQRPPLDGPVDRRVASLTGPRRGGDSGRPA